MVCLQCSTAKAKLSDHGVEVSRMGASVKVKDRGREKYLDKTQAAVVKAWETAETKGKDENNLMKGTIHPCGLKRIRVQWKNTRTIMEISR